MDRSSPVAPPAESSTTTSRARLAAGAVAGLTLLAIGWTGLLIPSLIRSIKDTFDQTDAGIGIVYLVSAVAYVAGSFAGGWLTEVISPSKADLQLSRLQHRDNARLQT